VDLLQQPERHHKRIHVALPVRVTYWDRNNRPAQVMACTCDISHRGARVTGLNTVKEVGEIVVVERGLSGKAFCRVVWIGEPKSGLAGQVGIECLESERTMWDLELQEMSEIFDPLPHIARFRRSRIQGSWSGNKRKAERFDAIGSAELLAINATIPHTEGGIINLSGTGCLIQSGQLLVPGSQLKLVLQVDNFDLTVKGEVRHSSPESGMGIEFHEIRKGDRQVLSYLLEKFTQQQFEEAFEFEGQTPALHI
jgi:PilZ domain